MIRRSCVCGCIQCELQPAGTDGVRYRKPDRPRLGQPLFGMRYLAVLSICMAQSARTVCPKVPFKMRRAFVRRKT
jgi:hypothetical protein